MKIKIPYEFCFLILLAIWGLIKVYHLCEENWNKLPLKNVILDNGYQKNVKAQIYFMTPQQVSDLYKTNPDDIPEHWQYQEKRSGNDFWPYKKPLYLVVRLKNEGNVSCLGKLLCSSEEYGSDEMQIITLPPKMNHFVNYTFYFSSYIRLDKLGNPDLKIEWETLYVKK